MVHFDCVWPPLKFHLIVFYFPVLKTVFFQQKFDKNLGEIVLGIFCHWDLGTYFQEHVIKEPFEESPPENLRCVNLLLLFNMLFHKVNFICWVLRWTRRRFIAAFSGLLSLYSLSSCLRFLWRLLLFWLHGSISLLFGLRFWLASLDFELLFSILLFLFFLYFLIPFFLHFLI